MEIPKRTRLKTITIKYGDVVVSIKADTQAQAKQNALEVFGILEQKYSGQCEENKHKDQLSHDKISSDGTRIKENE